MPKRYSSSANPGGNTRGQHSFAQVPAANIQRSSFNRSCGVKTTFDEGYLIPFFKDEVLPGDTFRMHPTIFARMATPLHPVMENIFADVFWFFVPNRLIWDNWERFNGAQDNPDDSTDFLVPVSTSPAGGYDVESLQDYLGIRPDIAGIVHTTFWLRAYNLIWNEWFRDQNLQDSVVVDKGNGPDTVTDYVKLRRGKRHDYFTSCLPFPQKGPAVSLPLGLTAPVVASGTGVDAVPTFDVNGAVRTLQTVNANPEVRWSGATPTNTFSAEWEDPNLVADLSAATAATINELRESFQIQRMFERDARGGTRYIEIVRSHFNVTSPDARLQRPEFLGGGSTRININPVAYTSQPDILTNIRAGDLGAFGTAAMYGNGFTKSFTEHGVILGLISIRADLNYQQGMEKGFFRRDRFEFYWPSLAHLGEQAVLNQEIFTQGTADDALVFGYQERFAEYRYKPSAITGKFRSDTPGGSFDTWHLAQDFATEPLLNADFIVEDAPFDRIIAVPSEPHFILDGWLAYTCVRPMPVFSVPGLIDHF